MYSLPEGETDKLHLFVRVSLHPTPRSILTLTLYIGN
jgi:hypothetical protein